jgi:hypothetical protein
MKLFSIIFSAILVSSTLFTAGCVTVPAPNQHNWIPVVKVDEFTGVKTSFATAGTEAGNMTRPGVLYPFVGVLPDGEIIVGLRSGGKFRVPVGNVQLRIDDHPAWDISMLESAGVGRADKPAAAGASIEAAIAQVQALSYGVTPYTAARGDKAKAILAQLLSGKKLKFRQAPGGLGMQPTTGEIELNGSLRNALLQIGVNPDSVATK